MSHLVQPPNPRIPFYLLILVGLILYVMIPRIHGQTPSLVEVVSPQTTLATPTSGIALREHPYPANALPGVQLHPTSEQDQRSFTIAEDQRSFASGESGESPYAMLIPIIATIAGILMLMTLAWFVGDIVILSRESTVVQSGNVVAGDLIAGDYPSRRRSVSPPHVP